MPRIVPGKLTLADLMILIGSTAVGLGGYVFIDDSLFQGGRYMFGVFNWSHFAWNSTLVLDKARGVLSMIMIAFGGWTFALPLIGFRKPRHVRTRLLRGPGMTACLAATTGLLFVAVATLLAFALRWMDGRFPLPPNFWNTSPILDSPLVLAGVAVAATWSAQVAAGSWRSTPSAFDRLGRFVGVLWILSGLVFAVRLFLG